MRRVYILAIIAASCLRPVEEGPDSGALSGDGGVGDSDGGTRCVEYGLNSGETVCAERTPGTCGGLVCGSGEACCLLNSRCFPQAQPELCPSPTVDGGSVRFCSSSLDCGTLEFCRSENGNLCGGRGVCSSIANCGFCSGGPMCRVCGCNGLTYDSPQVACVAGVRFLLGACGEMTPRGVNCGRSEQCPTGQACCALTGRCYSSSEAWRCQADVDAGVLDCILNSDCPSGAGGGNATAARWCAGQSCGTPGQCSPRGAATDCPGTIDPVCGCDGRTYINECWARAGGSRVVRRGECADAGQ
jgi:hypothetical protein